MGENMINQASIQIWVCAVNGINRSWKIVSFSTLADSKKVSDSEQVFAHSTLDYKIDSKPFEYQDDALESNGLKSRNSVVKEYQNGALCASKINEGDEDKLPYKMNHVDGWTAINHDHLTNLNDMTNDSEKDVRDLAARNSLSCQETESFEDSVFYMDKSVMECELPELIVCYKESTYHVKDISIDKGVPSQDRILFESDVDEKSVCSKLSHEKDQNGKPREEKMNNVMPLPYMLKSSAENGSNKDDVDLYASSPELDSDVDTVDLCDPKDLMLSEEVKDDETDRITDDASMKFLLRDFLSMQDLPTENSNSKSSNNNHNEAEKEQDTSGKEVSACPALLLSAEESKGGTEEAIFVASDTVSKAKESKNGTSEASLGNPALVSVPEEKHNDDKEATRDKDREEETVDNDGKEATLARPDLISGSEESANISPAEKFINNSSVETGRITSHSDASTPPTAKGSEECPLNDDSKHTETPETSRLEEALHQSVSSQVHSGLGEASFSATSRLEEASRQSVSSLIHSGLGDTSFSASAPISGLITYSGPIAYSGSLSLRSDSSTTSTRSFAFPILQSEWNTSPVKMAKADRRHFRKHKCWRQGLLCCRF